MYTIKANGFRITCQEVFRINKTFLASSKRHNKGKVVYNPLRLGTVIVLVSSGIDFVNTCTPRLYSDRATR